VSFVAVAAAVGDDGDEDENNDDIVLGQSVL
jgi:hypothetical protein